MHAFGNFPPLDDEKDENYFPYRFNVLSSIYAHSMHVNGKNQKMIIAYRYTDLLELYDMESNQLQWQITGPDFSFPPKDYVLSPDGRALPCESCKKAYQSPFITENYIFVLYLDKKHREKDNWIGNKIFVFDLEGKQISELILDLDISAFVIDEKGKKLLALDPFSDKMFFEYDISQIN